MKWFTDLNAKLLVETNANSPWTVSHGEKSARWNTIVANLKRSDPRFANLTCKKARDQFNKLINYWKKEDRKNLFKSGSVETYNTIERLLTDVVESMGDAVEEVKTETQAAKNKRQIQESKIIRDFQMKSMQKPQKTRKLGDDLHIPQTSKPGGSSSLADSLTELVKYQTAKLKTNEVMDVGSVVGTKQGKGHYSAKGKKIDAYPVGPSNTVSDVLRLSKIPDGYVDEYVQKLKKDGFDTCFSLLQIELEDLIVAGILKGHSRQIAEICTKLNYVEDDMEDIAVDESGERNEDQANL